MFHLSIHLRQGMVTGHTNSTHITDFRKSLVKLPAVIFFAADVKFANLQIALTPKQVGHSRKSNNTILDIEAKLNFC